MTAFFDRWQFLHGLALLDAWFTVCPARQQRFAATVQRHIEVPRLGASDTPEFHPWMIQAYAIFGRSWDTSFRCGPEFSRRGFQDHCAQRATQPAKMCVPRWLRGRLNREIPHTFCLSPAGYSTVRQDAVPAGPLPLELHPALACKARTLSATPYPSWLASRYGGGSAPPEHWPTPVPSREAGKPAATAARVTLNSSQTEVPLPRGDEACLD